MTISEYIQRLEELRKQHGDLMVLERRSDNTWMSMDGWWPQIIEALPSGSVLNNGVYYEPRGSDDDTVTALEI